MFDIQAGLQEIAGPVRYEVLSGNRNVCTVDCRPSCDDLCHSFVYRVLDDGTDVLHGAEAFRGGAFPGDRRQFLEFVSDGPSGEGQGVLDRFQGEEGVGGGGGIEGAPSLTRLRWDQLQRRVHWVNVVFSGWGRHLRFHVFLDPCTPPALGEGPG